MSIFANIRQRPRLFDWLHFFGIVSVHSQTRPEERACLCKHVSQARRAVEIGTFMGVTAAELAGALPPEGLLFCVDPYPAGGRPIQAVAQRHLRRSGVWERVRMVRADSQGAAAVLPMEIDFFFVDGDHSYEGLKTDWRLIKERLVRGGAAAFHDTARAADTNVHSEGAIRFFDEVIAQDPEFEKVEQIASLNVVRRKL